ncbi:MAG: deaminase [Candidatus Taylorbacteria bacterium]
MNYPYMPEGRSVEYVSSNNLYMKEAMKLCEEKSTDTQHPTGAVVVRDGVILGKGANQSAIKNSKLLTFHKERFCVRRLLKIPSGQKYWLCPGCASCRQHAESRAVKDAISRHGGGKVRGADLYLYGHWWCCKPCWDRMIKAGISRVFLVEGATELFTRKR